MAYDAYHSSLCVSGATRPRVSRRIESTRRDSKLRHATRGARAHGGRRRAAPRGGRHRATTH
eukprot:4274007-Prymnesium_polylepis.2